MHDVTAPVVGRREVASGMWVLGFEAAPIAREVSAGQFVNLHRVVAQTGRFLAQSRGAKRVPGQVAEQRLHLDIAAGRARRACPPRRGDTRARDWSW